MRSFLLVLVLLINLIYYENKNIYYYLVAFSSAGFVQQFFLDEKPLDFMSATNSFLTQEDIDCSVNNLYYLVRREFYSRDENRPMDYLYGTDIVYDGEPNGTERHSNMISAYHSTGNIASVHWSLLYHTISTANTIIDRLPVSEVSEEQKVIAEAKARFFRGFAYRTLAYLYGGVPLFIDGSRRA